MTPVIIVVKYLFDNLYFHIHMFIIRIKTFFNKMSSSPTTIFIGLKDPLFSLRQSMTIEISLKIMKKPFHFMLQTLFVIEIFTFLLYSIFTYFYFLLFGYIEKRFNMFNFKTYDITG